MVSGDAVIHELYKGILRYETEAVLKMLKEKKVNSKLLDFSDPSSPRKNTKVWSEEELIKFTEPKKRPYHSVITQGKAPFQSPSELHLKNLKRIYADVSWAMGYLDMTVQYVVVHEVKTGKFDTKEIFDKNSQYGYYHKPTGQFHDINQIWIWGQERYLIGEKEKYKEVIPQVKNGLVQFRPIEWLKPLVDKKIKENPDWVGNIT